MGLFLLIWDNWSPYTKCFMILDFVRITQDILRISLRIRHQIFCKWPLHLHSKKEYNGQLLFCFNGHINTCFKNHLIINAKIAKRSRARSLDHFFFKWKRRIEWWIPFLKYHCFSVYTFWNTLRVLSMVLKPLDWRWSATCGALRPFCTCNRTYHAVTFDTAKQRYYVKARA